MKANITLSVDADLITEAKVLAAQRGTSVSRMLVLTYYLAWEVVVNDGGALVEALEFESRYKLSFWDALIAQAANAAGDECLCSEDFNHGQVCGTVTAVNPFR